MVQSSPLSAQTVATLIPIELPVTYLHFNQGDHKPLLLLFHGYEDTAAGVVRRSLVDAKLFPEFEILAPNGFFPMPVRVDGGFKQTHAWYFADFSKKQVLIPPQVAAQGVARLIEQLNLQDRPKILIGFSQGGFFLPFVLPGLKNVKKLIGMAAGYRIADYPQNLAVPVDAIHGSEDKIVHMAGAKEGFEKLAAINPNGDFFAFPDLGHTMNAASREVLKKQIKEDLP